MIALSELGQRLKEAREEKGISIEDLQKVTKIQKRYLLAIEEGNLDTLPGKFYARAFVKSYAEAIGLDTDELFDNYSEELPNPQSGNADLPPRVERSKRNIVPTNSNIKKKSNPQRKRSKFAAVLPTAIALVFILIIGVGVWIMAQQWGMEQAEGIAPEEQEQPFEGEIGEVIVPEDSEEAPEGTPAAPEEEPEPAVEEPEVTQKLEQLQASGNHSFYELSQTDEFEVVIQFTGTSYVGIKNAKGKTFFAGEARANDEQTYDFSGEEEIEFNFGASPYVQLYINEELFEFPLDKIHQKVTIVFSTNIAE